MIPPFPPAVSQATNFHSNAVTMPQTYDTFSLGFEQDLIDQDEQGNDIKLTRGPTESTTIHQFPETRRRRPTALSTTCRRSQRLISAQIVRVPPRPPGTVTAGERETMARILSRCVACRLRCGCTSPTRGSSQITVVQLAQLMPPGFMRPARCSKICPSRTSFVCVDLGNMSRWPAGRWMSMAT